MMDAGLGYLALPVAFRWEAIFVKTGGLALLVSGLLVLPLCLGAITNEFTQELFDQFVHMRSGDGSHPVCWPCAGEVYSFPEGKLVAPIEGLDTGRLVRTQEKRTTAHGLHWSIMLYREPGTSRLLREYQGKPLNEKEPKIKFMGNAGRALAEEDALVLTDTILDPSLKPVAAWIV